MTSKIIYQGGLRTSSTHLASGDTIMTDAPVDNKGRGEAFSPTDLVSTALGNCMITIMGIAAQAHDMNIDNTEVHVTKIMKSDPRRIGKIEIVFFMKGQVEFSDKEKKILEVAALTCPVALSLHPDLEQDVQFNW